MVSTLLGYRLYASNLSKSLERIEATGSVKKDAAYYKANIGKVTSVDAFLSDYRLYSYAMKAYGLEDQISSKGLMRKVLQSDLGDAASFANKLTDAKYRTFAAAFNFKAVAGNDTKVVQSTAQQEALTDAYSERRVRQGTVAAAKTADYAARIGTVDDVSDILNDATLLDVVLGSIGVSADEVPLETVRQALTDTLPAGFSSTNPGWFTLHETFNFDTNGALAGGATAAQSADAADDLIYRYNVATGNDVNPAAAAFNTRDFEAKVAALADAHALFTDARSFAYLATAFGFDPSLESASYASGLVFGGTDASSPINQLPTDTAANAARKEKFLAMQAAVLGMQNGGTARDTAKETVVDGYYANYKTLATAKDATATSSFEYLIGRINSVTDLLAKDEVFGRDALNYALKAFDIDPDSVSLPVLRSILTSDVSDPNSYVNKLKDERFEKFAAAFNFDSNGKTTTQRLIQSTNSQTATGTKYTASFGTMSAAQKEIVTADTKSYLGAMASLNNLDDFLADTKTVNYALKAYGLDKLKLSTADVRKILTSDLGDPKSFANARNDKRTVDFAKAFNFETDGTVLREAASGQSSGSRLTTQNLYLLQTLEAKAGEENEGVRLALYFRRKAPDVTSTLGLLADKPLLQVVKTAFGLPDGFVQLDIDKQIAILDKKVKVADFQDSKKLDKFITRFAALYDVNNADQLASTSPALQLFGGSSGSGILGLF